jgi:hypothetical protein
MRIDPFCKARHDLLADTSADFDLFNKILFFSLAQPKSKV